MPNFSPEKQEKRNFGLIFSALFEQDRLLFARIDNDMTESPTKAAKKEEEKIGFETFFQKWVCASRFQWRTFIFLAAEKLTFLGGGITSKLASQ